MQSPDTSIETHRIKSIIRGSLVREGLMLSGHDGNWEKAPYREGKEVIVGYYHIKANDLDQAIVIAKDNPEFEYTQTAPVEVRPIKMKEEATEYLYPVG